MTSTKPWETEENKLEFEHAGLKCLITRHTAFGHLCGYVLLPKEHPFFNEDIENIPKCDILVHGGITFHGLDGPYWKVGFDCAHFGDLVPKLFEYRGNHPVGPSVRFGETYKDINYVSAECKKLAEQLAEVWLK